MGRIFSNLGILSNDTETTYVLEYYRKGKLVHKLYHKGRLVYNKDARGTNLDDLDIPETELAAQDSNGDFLVDNNNNYLIIS